MAPGSTGGEWGDAGGRGNSHQRHICGQVIMWVRGHGPTGPSEIPEDAQNRPPHVTSGLAPGLQMALHFQGAPACRDVPVMLEGSPSEGAGMLFTPCSCRAWVGRGRLG